ncbi:MAG: FHA domain-containing protein [Planctomycetaceae bacterium]|jgi:hypothetical protein|nr:FHA domain-containing protein [Planctomycetaceae bacterium]
MSDKITISWEDISSPKVDEKIRIDNAMLRAAQHQQQVLRDYKSAPVNSDNIFYKAVVYLALFGLVFGFVGWMLSEIPAQIEKQAREHAEVKAVERLKSQIQSGEIHAPPSDIEAHKMILNNMSQDEDFTTISVFCWLIWYMLICSFIGFGLSSAEGFMEHNYSRAFIRGLIAVIIGVVIGPFAMIVAELLYHKLGGGNIETNFVVQMFARSLAWIFIGCFVAITPGIVMKNGKKLGLGVAGGAIGGLLGGLLFDPISIVTQTDILSRLVGIIGFGVLTGLAMGLLEEAAKQGWLKVVAGVIAGKQFIIYKNPTVIGSSPKCEIYLFKDAAVMPQHAAIRQQDTSFIIEQINPTHPVFINGRPTQRHTLQNGDAINIGKSQFVFGTKEIKSN